MKAYANMSAYCASKAAVKHLTKVAALEYATSGIRANSIHPGIIRTPAWDMLGGLDGDGNELPDLDDMAKATVPLAYVGLPDDIANAVLYLASDESRYVTGAELVVDGGQNIA
jgi:3alpha(or 20beta)-hydroxysteroid dehydrogenase